MSRRPREFYDVVFHPAARWFAIGVLLVSFVLPPAGFSFDLCWFKNLFHLPCPGCGLTRSMTNLSHGDVIAAMRYHPFGPIFYAGAVLMAGVQLGGRRADQAMRLWFAAHDSALRTVYIGGIYVFIAFGLARLTWVILWPGSFPGV